MFRTGDITKIKAEDIPNHDILVGGFPCQPFSIAGVSSKKALGRKHGFEDETQRTLFFDIVRIIREKKPRAFLLENVKNLKGHDKGNTFRVIMKKLREDLGYDVHYDIVDASSVVPQHRERIFIAGFKRPMDFAFPKLIDSRPKLAEVLEKSVDEKIYADRRNMEGAAEAQGECTEKGKRLRVQHGGQGQHCKNPQRQILQGRRGDSHTAGKEKSEKAHAEGVRQDHGLSGKVSRYRCPTTRRTGSSATRWWFRW